MRVIGPIGSVSAFEPLAGVAAHVADELFQSVIDDGVGIPDKIQGKVFEPYFSTKPTGRGSGLGLPMARGFLEQSGGQLDLFSTPGQGAQVDLHIPGTTWSAR